MAKYKSPDVIIGQIKSCASRETENLTIAYKTKEYMKRFGHLYEQICSMDNLKYAHKNAMKGKGWYKEVVAINKDPDKYLKKLQNMLINHTYRTSKYNVFIKDDSRKKRVIYKLPYFPDRIAQWAVISVIEPYLIRHLTSDTYSAIPGRGIHYGLKRVVKDMQHDVVGCQYCLKIDVHHYYQSIDHNILKQKYRKIFKDKELLWILDEIIDSISTSDNGSEETGIPIGNYLSQYSGNLYLSDFDHWMKEQMHVKHYHRYMDDIVIFSDSKEKLHKLKVEIDEYFKMNLKLEIKSNWQIFPSYARGIDYLGYRVFLNYVLLRKTTCKQMKKKMLHILKKCRKNHLMNYSEWCSINSYKGWLKWCNGFRLQKKYIYPLEIYANFYYMKVIKKKGSKND